MGIDAHSYYRTSVQNPDWAAIVLDRAPFFVCVVDRQGTILFQEGGGTPEGEPSLAAGTCFYDFLPAADQAAAKAAIDRVFNEGKTGSFEYAISAPAGTRWYFTLVQELDGGGEPSAAALYIQEHTHVHRAQEENQANLQELKRLANQRNQILQEYTRHIEAGEKLNILLAATHESEEVFPILAEYAMKAMNASFSAIFRINHRWIEYLAGLKAPTILHRKECLDEDSLIKRILTSNQTYFMQEIDPVIEMNLWRTSLTEQNIHSLLIVPLNFSESFTGILYLGFYPGTEVRREDMYLVHSFAEAARDSVRRIHVMKRLEQHIRSRDKELAVLYDIGMLSNEASTLDDLLRKAVGRLMSAVHCDSAIVYFFHERMEEMEEFLSIWPQTGIPAGVKQYLRQHTAAEIGSNFLSPLMIADLPNEPSLACVTLRPSPRGIKTSVIRIFGESQYLHDPEILHLINSAAGQIGLAIESLWHRKRAEEALVLEERQRLARNLHDSITQSLYALTLSGDAAVKILARGEYDQLRETLVDITNCSLQASKEMRLMLFELRPAALEHEGLREAIKLRLDTVERRTGMAAELDCPDNINIPEALENEIYNIITEALNNSLRHSGARRVKVSMKSPADLLTIDIEDDGIGFDLSSRSRGGLGLTSMNERARKLGGALTIASESGKGTRVCFKIKIPKNVLQ